MLILFRRNLQDLPRPENDECASATVVTPDNTMFLDSTTGSFPDFESTTCSVSPSSRGVWYTFQADGEVNIQVTQATFNTRLVALSGEDCSLQSCIDNNDGTGNSAALTLTAVPGTVYYILVTGVSGFTNVGTFEIDFIGNFVDQEECRGGISAQVFGDPCEPSK